MPAFLLHETAQSGMITIMSVQHVTGIPARGKILLALLLLLMSAACQPDSSQSQATPLPTLTPIPTPTPTKAPPGTSENPLTLALVGDQTDPDLQNAGQFVAKTLTDGTGIPVTYRILPNAEVLISDMSRGDAQIYFLLPATYIYAHSRSLADAQLLFSHYGLYAYGTQFFFHKDSGVFSYFDENSQSSVAGAEIALNQLQGKRPCWVSPDSVSGYLLPAAFLEGAGVRTQDPVFTYTTSASLRALYITGICDFAATYGISGDPRTAEAVVSDLTDVNQRIQVLWQSEAIIPSMNISFHPVLTTDQAQALLTSFLVMGGTETGQQWLMQAAQYQLDGMMIIDDSYYDDFRLVLEGYEYDPREFIGK